MDDAVLADIGESPNRDVRVHDRPRADPGALAPMKVNAPTLASPATAAPSATNAIG